MHADSVAIRGFRVSIASVAANDASSMSQRALRGSANACRRQGTSAWQHTCRRKRACVANSPTKSQTRTSGSLQMSSLRPPLRHLKMWRHRGQQPSQAAWRNLRRCRWAWHGPRRSSRSRRPRARHTSRRRRGRRALSCSWKRSRPSSLRKVHSCGGPNLETNQLYWAGTRLNHVVAYGARITVHTYSPASHIAGNPELLSCRPAIAANEMTIPDSHICASS